MNRDDLLLMLDLTTQLTVAVEDIARRARTNVQRDRLATISRDLQALNDRVQGDGVAALLDLVGEPNVTPLKRP